MIEDTEKDVRIRRLYYRANHRGIKEMDIILGGFAATELVKLSDRELDDFEALMEESDRDLFSWFINEVAFPLPELQAIFERVSADSLNGGKVG
ncbi:MAG: succinate dehydrogenase assembly factor 2 [Pseudomonadota bacterium]